MTILDALTRLDSRIQAATDRHIQRHPIFWAVLTLLLFVAVAAAAAEALA